MESTPDIVEQDYAEARKRYFTTHQVEAFVAGASHGRTPGGAGWVYTGNLRIRINPLEVVRDNVELNGISNLNARLLQRLARDAGHLIPNRALLADVWGAEYINDDHYLRLYILRLRAILGTRYIENEFGRGYKLAILPIIEVEENAS